MKGLQSTTDDIAIGGIDLPLLQLRAAVLGQGDKVAAQRDV